MCMKECGCVIGDTVGDAAAERFDFDSFLP